MSRYSVGTSFAVERVISVDVHTCRALRPSNKGKRVIGLFTPCIQLCTRVIPPAPHSSFFAEAGGERLDLCLYEK